LGRQAADELSWNAIYKRVRKYRTGLRGRLLAGL
jgi:hypothetical protein